MKIAFTLTLLAVTQSWAMFVPDDPRAAILTRDRTCIEFFLQQLRPEVPPLARDFTPTDDEDPSYYVRLTDEATGLLRADLDERSVPYLAFANEFIFVAPDTPVSLARVLKTTKELETVLEQADGTNLVYFPSEDNETSEELSLLLTLSLPGQTGSKYLEKQTAYTLRRGLATFHWLHLASGNPNDDMFRQHVAGLENLWNQAEPNVRQDLKKDLITLLPFLDETPDEEVISAFTGMPLGLSYEEISPLFNSMVLERLPKTLQTAVADHWALAYTLGLDTFNAEHWMVVEPETVLLPVHALRWSEAFEQALEQYTMPSPVSTKDDTHFVLDEQFEGVLREKVSPEMSCYLADLTLDAAYEIAVRTRLPITFDQLNGLLQRAHTFPPRRSNWPTSRLASPKLPL